MRLPVPEHDVVALALILHELQRRLERDQRVADHPQHLLRVSDSEVLRHTQSDLKPLVWSDEGEISTAPGCSPVTSPSSRSCLDYEPAVGTTARSSGGGLSAVELAASTTTDSVGAALASGRSARSGTAGTWSFSSSSCSVRVLLRRCLPPRALSTFFGNIELGTARSHRSVIHAGRSSGDSLQ
jgi:hypothetical protein